MKTIRNVGSLLALGSWRKNKKATYAAARCFDPDLLD